MPPFELPPPPATQLVDSWQWRDWFFRLRSAVLAGLEGSGSAGQIPISAGPGQAPVWTTVRVEQAFTAKTDIVVEHDFGFWPHVQVWDSNACMIIPKRIRHIDLNTVVVVFSIPVTGTIVVSM